MLFSGKNVPKEEARTSQPDATSTFDHESALIFIEKYKDVLTREKFRDAFATFAEVRAKVCRTASKSHSHRSRASISSTLVTNVSPCLCHSLSLRICLNTRISL